MTIPERPQPTEDMVRQAARKIAPRLNPHDKPTEERLINDIVLCYELSMDGYELAKELDDRFCWHLNQSDVEYLGEVNALVEEHLEKDIAAWVARYYPEQPLPNGTAIQEGVIKGVYEYAPGYFEVQEAGCHDPDQSLLIQFESAVPVGPADFAAQGV